MGRRLFWAFLIVLSAAIARAQTTPNLGLNIPSPGTTGWGSLLNTNFSTLDSYLGGSLPLPILSAGTFSATGVTATNLTFTKITGSTCTSFLGWLCVDAANTAGWTGNDPGAWINSAYAAAPARGGRILILSGVYPNVTTPILISTASKPAALICDPETTLTWGPTTGTMFTFNYGNASSLHDRNAGIFGCTLAGQSSGSASALVLGGANGAEGFKFWNGHINWPSGTAITWGNNTWATNILGSSIVGQVVYSFPIGVTSSGEDIEINNSLAQGVSSGYVGCASFANSGLALNTFGGSFDDCQLVLGAGSYALNGTHFENPGTRSDSYGNPSLTIAGNANLNSITIFQDFATPTKSQEILVSGGGNVTITGGGYASNGTIADFLTNSGSGVVQFMHGPQTFGGYTALANVTAGGKVLDFFGNGASGPVLTVFTSGGTQTIQIPPGLSGLMGVSLNSTNGFYQSKKAVAGCTTAASIGGVCASPTTVNWPTAFGDSNYSVNCTPSGAPTNLPGAPYVSAKASGSVTVNYFAISAAAASWAAIDCEAIHD